MLDDLCVLVLVDNFVYRWFEFNKVVGFLFDALVYFEWDENLCRGMVEEIWFFLTDQI